MYGIKTHPCLKEPTVPFASDEEAVAGFEDSRRPKEPTSLTFNKYRLDLNTLKMVFKVLEGCQHI